MQKIILHIDLDSFFASCEQQAKPELRGQPIAVCGNPKGRSVISAASREAKKFGVRSAMRIGEGLRLCPRLILVRGDSHLYGETSRKARAVFQKYGLAMQVASIDEVFLDVTETLNRFGGLKALVQKLKADLAAAAGEYVTCSVGAAWNKPLAKLASDMKKPNGFMEITPQNFERVLEQIKPTDFAGVGPATGGRLKNLGVNFAIDLRKLSAERLRLIFGQQGEWLWGLARGLSDDKVLRDVDEPLQKSLGHEDTFKRDLEYDDCFGPLQAISAKVAERLRRQNFAGSEIGLVIRYRNFETKRFRGHLGFATADTFYIARAARSLFEKHADKQRLVRLLGVTVGNLTPGHKTSRPLFKADLKQISLFSAMDKIKAKHGQAAIGLSKSALRENNRFDPVEDKRLIRLKWAKMRSGACASTGFDNGITFQKNQRAPQG